MNIAVVHYPINDVGGIDSWCKNFVLGCKQIGSHCQIYYATAQTRYECDPNKELVKSRYCRLKSKHLSYRPERLKATVEELNGYDLILMLHPSPHPTRKNTGEHCRNWMELYRQTTPPKLVVFHDVNWEKTNAWFAEVAEHVDLAMAAQRMFLDPVNRYPCDCPKRWDHFPLNLRLGRSLKRQMLVREGLIVCTQWIKLKNHRHFLPQANQVNCQVHLYGNGQEYYELRKLGVLQEAIRLDKTTGKKHNWKSRNVFYGFVPYEEVLSRMAQCVASLDLSIKGQVNMTHWEPLTVGTVSMIERRVSEHPANQLPSDCSFVYDLGTVADDVNELLGHSHLQKMIVKNGTQFIQRAECHKVARRTLTWAAKHTGVKL